LGQLLLLLLIISTLLFFLIRLTGDPAELLAGENARPETVVALRDRYGLADPVGVQYFNFLKGAVQLDFGRSIAADVPAMQLIMERLPSTLVLAFTTLTVAVLIAIPLGVTAALHRGQPIDRLISLVVSAGQSIPTFVFGLLLIFVFAVNLKWLPTSGQDGPQYLVLPTTALSFGFIALLTRLVRSNMLDVIELDYIRTARSKGLNNTSILLRHALPNILLTVLTVLGLNLSSLVGGAVVVEQLFAWPGIGAKLLNAIINRDFPVVQAGVFVVALLVFTVNALVDYLYQLVDPRMRHR
jgi:peptide/nickel transport system permease protein